MMKEFFLKVINLKERYKMIGRFENRKIGGK